MRRILTVVKKQGRQTNSPNLLTPLKHQIWSFQSLWRRLEKLILPRRVVRQVLRRSTLNYRGRRTKRDMTVVKTTCPLIARYKRTHVICVVKRHRMRSSKISGVYTPDPRVKTLFKSEEKVEYKPIAKTNRTQFKKFAEILSTCSAYVFCFPLM
ncbi:hypothetical protein YC2023_015181 [Brassica napus]